MIVDAEREVQRARAADMFRAADDPTRQNKREEGHGLLTMFLAELEASPARAHLQGVIDDVKYARDGMRDMQAWTNYGNQFMGEMTLTSGQIVIGSSAEVPTPVLATAAYLRMDPDEL